MLLGWITVHFPAGGTGCMCTGEILADTVQPYKHQVMDQTLPDGKTKLSRNWALQHPQDYLDAMEITIKSVLEQTGICGECVIGIG